MADNTKQPTGKFMENRAEKIAPLELPAMNLGIVELLNSLSSNFAAPSEETLVAQRLAMESFPKNTGETTKIPPVSAGLLDTVKGMFGSAAETVTSIEQQLRNVIDTAPLLPDAPNPLVKSLLLDQAVAATNAAKEVSADAALNASRMTGTIGKSTSASATITTLPVASGAGKQMLEAFKSAFPDRKFELTEVDGMITVEDKGKLSETAGVVSQVPVGYNPETAARGLNDVQTQLMQETDPKKQLELAYKLKSMVAIQSAAKYGQYTAQADAENQVPDLVQALALSRQLDAQSATVRASGMMSKQTYELLGALAQARNGAAKRAKELMQMDPVLGQADTIATLHINKLEKGALLDQRIAINDQRTRQEEERVAQVNDLKSNPTLLPRVALLKTGQPLAKGSEDALANQIASGKIHLDDTDKMIIQTPAENLARLYQDSQDQKLRTKLLPVMLYEEAKNLQGKTGGIPEGKVALERAKQFRAVMDTPMTSPEMAPYRKQYEKDMLEVNTTMTGANKTKGATEAATRAHLRYIDDMVIKKEQSDIRNWQGLMKSDATATAVMKQYADAKPGTAIPMKEFVSSYLNYKDGKGKADKITTLRALVSSHVDSIPQSVFFPKPAVSSFLGVVDKLTAASLLDSIHLTGMAAVGRELYNNFGGQ